MNLPTETDDTVTAVAMAQETPTRSPLSTGWATKQKWDEKYLTGPTPWDTRITPPEVRHFWATRRLDPASTSARMVALDLGCGPGTNTAYLAGQGLHAIGVEISSVALALARRRIAAASLAGRMEFIQADVTNLPVANGGADYILDIGCLHGLPLEDRSAYAQSVVTNLRVGGYYHLFAFDRTPEQEDNRGLREGELNSLFAPHLRIVQAVQAQPDMRPCHWYLLQQQ
jgi:SAM-dependent methyltransferase